MSGFVKKDEVFIDVDVSTREEVLEFISKEAVRLGVADDEATVLDAFHKRESEGATGLQGGFAIPHAQSDAIKKSAVIVVKPKQTIEWETLDGSPVTVAIGLLCPTGEAGKDHLRLLSQLAVMLMRPKFCDTVRDAEDASHIADAINSCFDGECE